MAGQPTSEIARLRQECDQLTVRLREEETKRSEVELKLQAALQDARENLLMEQEIRDECWSQMEAGIQLERERWKVASETERAQAEGYLDGKIEIIEKGGTIDSHDCNNTAKTEGLERDNEKLRRKVESLERQLNLRSPSKSLGPGGRHYREA
jgi:hypothetical protein